MLKSNLWLAIQKLGTLGVDRRLIAFFVIVVLTVVGYPYLLDRAGSLDQQYLDIAYIAVTGAELALGLPVLLWSFTKRPPSGLNWKELPTELEQLIPILSEIFKNKPS